ncbi:MAG: hypothetical protein FWC64_02335 [Treponema sp.]|nr:hypothetical protein [Treponema sp.]
MKIVTCGCILILLASGLSWGQWQTGRPWWYRLEEGKLLLRSGAYGNALIAFEDARRGRHAQFTRMEEDLIRLLSTPEARLLGDSLYFIEQYIAFRNETAAAAALAYLFHRVPRTAVGGSATRALEEIDRLKGFPEAEFWMGEAFMAEGELLLALRQYERAWEYRALLETPGFDTEILYRMTDIHRMRQDYPEMERLANEIITGAGPSGLPRDDLWTMVHLRAAMARLLETEGAYRFLELYRHNNMVTERAHRLLGFFLHATSRDITAVDHLMFAFLIQNTVLIDYVIRRQFDFAFTTLDDLMERVLSRPALVDFMEETEYFRTAFYFSAALYATGRTVPAMQLWTFLAQNAHAGVWGERARRSPAPYLEAAVGLLP